MKTLWALLALSLSFFGGVGQAAPANDNFGNAEILTGTSISRATSTVAATAEEGEPNHGPQLAAASVWYRWTAPENGVVNISTFGSDFDTILATFTGEALTNLVSVAANDDAP